MAQNVVRRSAMPRAGKPNRFTRPGSRQPHAGSGNTRISVEPSFEARLQWPPGAIFATLTVCRKPPSPFFAAIRTLPFKHALGVGKPWRLCCLSWSDFDASRLPCGATRFLLPLHIASFIAFKLELIHDSTDQQVSRFQVGAIVISPTRELASQTMQVAKPFITTVSWLTALLLVGGT